MKNKMLNCKHSQGHIEIILSFVIFLGFLIMIFVFFNPVQQPKTSSAILEDVQEKLLDYLSIDYDYTSLILTPSALSTITSSKKNCFSVNNTIGFKSGEHLIVLDLNNKVLDSSTAYPAKFKIENSSNANNQLYKLYISKYPDTDIRNFNPYHLSSSETCVELPSGSYSFGALTSDSLVLQENLPALNDYYVNGSYKALKTDLKITDDFEFIVYDLNRNVIMNESLTKHKIKTTNVFSREILLKTINKNATQGSIILGLRVW